VPRETVTIEISKLPPYEAAAQLFAVLAYLDDKAARTRFADATCNVMLRQFAAADPTLVDTPQATVRPRHWMLEPDKADLTWKRGVKVLMDERLEAARMASPRWATAVEQITGLPHPGLKNLGHLSGEMLAAISSSLDERRGNSTEGYNKRNIGTRVWKTSKPVIHLCLGMRRVIEETMPDHRTFNPWAFFGVPKLTYAVIERASRVFKLADQVFDGIDPDQLWMKRYFFVCNVPAPPTTPPYRRSLCYPHCYNHNLAMKADTARLPDMMSERVSFYVIVLFIICNKVSVLEYLRGNKHNEIGRQIAYRYRGFNNGKVAFGWSDALGASNTSDRKATGRSPRI
jgi:hypothetical protein